MSAATVATEPVEQPSPEERAKPGARVRLGRLVEPPARPLAADGPLAGPPPLAGSKSATARDGAALRERSVRPVRSEDDAALPDPTPLCCAMVQAAVEILRGTRPLAQLARWVTPEIFEQLAMRSELTQRVLGRGEGMQRAAIRRIRLCRLGADTAEATVVVNDGPRVRAVAVRLEGYRGQWRATALEIG
ncbi:MAG TPA: Rv3235 family protein [Cellulomonas sp.]